MRPVFNILFLCLPVQPELCPSSLCNFSIVLSICLKCLIISSSPRKAVPSLHYRVKCGGKKMVLTDMTVWVKCFSSDRKPLSWGLDWENITGEVSSCSFSKMSFMKALPRIEEMEHADRLWMDKPSLRWRGNIVKKPTSLHKVCLDKMHLRTPLYSSGSGCQSLNSLSLCSECGQYTSEEEKISPPLL